MDWESIDRAVEVVEPDYAIRHLELLDEIYSRLLPVQCTISNEFTDTIEVPLTATMGPAMAIRALLTTWMNHAIAIQKIVVYQNIWLHELNPMISASVNMSECSSVLS